MKKVTRVLVERCYVRLGQAIAVERKWRDWTQVELSRKMRLSRASLANIEAGRQRIYIHQVLAIEKALKCKGLLEKARNNTKGG